MARALQLDDVEHEHLRNLLHAARPSPLRAPRSRARQAVRPTVQKVLDALDVPGFVQNSRLEIVAADALGQALYADAEGDHRLTLPFSMPHFVFLDPRSSDFYGD